MGYPIGRVYSKNADDDLRRAKQFFYHLALSSAMVYYCVLRNVTVEEEEKVDNSSAPQKTQLEVRSNANNEVQDVKIDEDDVQVPETIPVDAFFIPLGRIRQVPQTYYKHSDPEWQSFAEFGQDRKRRVAVQSMFVYLTIGYQKLMLY